MSISVGMKVTHKNGDHGIVMKPGQPTEVMSLSSGELQNWVSANYKADEKPDNVGSVFIVNPPDAGHNQYDHVRGVSGQSLYVDRLGHFLCHLAALPVGLSLP
jgi:hypothetical protein